MSLVNEVEEFIKENGAITEAQLCKAFEMSKPAARSLLAKMILHERIVWVAALPRQASCWFALVENEGQFAFPLRGKATGGRGPSKNTTELMSQLMSELQLEEWTVPELIDLYENVPRHQIYRAMRRLEAQGSVVSRVWHDAAAGRGRPPLLWRAAGTEPMRSSIDSERERRKARSTRDEASSSDEAGDASEGEDWQSVVSFDDE